MHVEWTIFKHQITNFLLSWRITKNWISFTGYNPIFNWAFQAAEDAVHLAVNTAAPIINTLDRPIQFVDQTLCSGIDKLEAKAPIIKEPPQEIYQQARNKVVDVVQPTLNRVCSMRVAGQQKAHSLKDLSWQKANEVLATQYGSMAVSGLDTTSALAERLLDYYFPKNENDAAEDDNSKYILLEKHSFFRANLFTFPLRWLNTGVHVNDELTTSGIKWVWTW